MHAEIWQYQDRDFPWNITHNSLQAHVSLRRYAQYAAVI